MPADTSDDAADTVLFLLDPGHQRFHFFSGCRIGTADQIIIDHLTGDRAVIHADCRNFADGTTGGIVNEEGRLANVVRFSTQSFAVI